MKKDPSVKELHSVRKKMWDASMANHIRYLDRDTGRFGNDFVENRTCPACGIKDYRPLFQKSGGIYVACSDCEMVFLNPALKDNFLEEYYRINHEEQSEIVELDTEFYRTLYAMGLDMIAKSTPVGKLLDVGCSSGSFLDLARQYGWKTHGLELNQKEAARCRAKGHNVVEQLISSAEFEDSFQAITLWDVFEHIKDGVEFLKAARKRLDSRGVVFLQSPTVDSLAAKILQEKCNMFDGLEHVNLYSNKTLHIVAKNAGFRVVSYQTVISEIGVINNYLNYEDPYLGRSNNKDHLFRGTITQSWLLENNLGYKYQACLVPC